ncbi:MAG: hypothetical protein JJ863_07015 [Deltaproteobacteria bacterium]|nr:hypothetical protein [Deltaproteobacteria bacterium]
MVATGGDGKRAAPDVSWQVICGDEHWATVERVRMKAMFWDLYEVHSEGSVGLRDRLAASDASFGDLVFVGDGAANRGAVVTGCLEHWEPMVDGREMVAIRRLPIPPPSPWRRLVRWLRR